MGLSCSVVVRCYNEERHIGRLLTGLMRQTVRPRDVILVDSGSTDRTLAIARKYPVKVVHIRREEFSFGRSLNRGCRETSGDVLVLASAHTYSVYDDWIEKLLAPFEDPKVALVYGKQSGGETTRYSEHRIFRSWFPSHPNGNQTHAFCNNANAAVRRSVWEQIPYDESLTGLEDIAWAKQALALGYRIVYEPEAEIIHIHEERPSQIFNRYRREGIAMKTIYPAMRFTFWNFLRLWSVNVASDWSHAAREGKLWRNLLDVIVFRFLQFWGTYRGHAQYGPVTESLRAHLYYPNGSRLRPGHAPGSGTSPRRGARVIDYSEEELLDADH